MYCHTNNAQLYISEQFPSPAHDVIIDKYVEVDQPSYQIW